MDNNLIEKPNSFLQVSPEERHLNVKNKFCLMGKGALGVCLRLSESLGSDVVSSGGF